MPGAQIRVVSGKGGVGKTVAATALALAAARRGRRVLLCEMNGGDRIASLLGVAAEGYRLREVFDNLWLVDIQPQEALHEYVLLVLRFEALYKTFFDNPLVRSFTRAVPALGELVMIGKIWYHATPQGETPAQFDLIVVDAPASGHALALLGAPRAVAQAVPPGPMRDNAELLQRMLEDPQQTRLHAVTRAEDMPLTETLQLLERARAMGIRLGSPLLNAVPPPLPEGALQALQAARGDGLQDAWGTALRRRLQRQQDAAQQLRRLQLPELPAAVPLPLLARQPLGLADLEALAAHLAAAWQRGELDR